MFPAGDSAARIVAISAKAIDGTMLSYPDINEALRLGMHEFAKMPSAIKACWCKRSKAAASTWRCSIRS